MRASGITAAMLWAALVAGCKSEQNRAAVPADTGAVVPAAAPAVPQDAGAAAIAADTTAEALMTSLKQANYTSWPLWPGRQKYYKGQEPHGALLVTYVNQLAQDAVTNGAAQMPNGAIIVKENYGPDKKLMATTVMKKVQGYDPKNHDWFWAKYDASGGAQMAGRVDMCTTCHKGAAQYDELWTLMKDKTGKTAPPMKM